MWMFTMKYSHMQPVDNYYSNVFRFLTQNNFFTADYVCSWEKNDGILQNGLILLKYVFGFSNANRKCIILIHRRRNICRCYTRISFANGAHYFAPSHPNRLIHLQTVFLDRKRTRPINAIFTKRIVL